VKGSSGVKGVGCAYKTTINDSALELLIRLAGNIRLAGFIDIAAMKPNAITGNGTRIKDFIDIAYLSSKIPLNKMLEGYEMKYNANPIIPIKAIAFLTISISTNR